MEWLKNLSLKKSFFLLTLCGLLLSLVLLLLLWSACGAVAARYPSGGVMIEMGMGTVKELPGPAPEQMGILHLLGIIRLLGSILLPLLGLGAAGAFFYRWKLKEPISVLMEGTRRIQNHDLDFSIQPASGDELGQLCAAFETMRAELLKTNQELWRQSEERKRLNAAFAHDLRNPITVLKGSVKLLRQGTLDEQILDRLESYTLRIEQYVEAMSGIQRMEQMPVRPSGVAWDRLREELEETAWLLAPGLDTVLSVPEAEAAIQLDHGLFLTVAENLIGNGARFARKELKITLALEENILSLIVADDGPGFPSGLLKSGPKPFGKMQEEPEHFGMGLYSSKLLCLKHGGNLRLENTRAGGASAAASFQINCKP